MNEVRLVMRRGPGPNADFIETEDELGRSCKVGEWRTRQDGFVELVIPLPYVRPLAEEQAARWLQLVADGHWSYADVASLFRGAQVVAGLYGCMADHDEFGFWAAFCEDRHRMACLSGESSR